METLTAFPVAEPRIKDLGYGRDPVSEYTATERFQSYQQLYDTKGHPINLVSAENHRQSRRAQNDILALAGVCYPVDANGEPHLSMGTQKQLALDTSRIEGIRHENEVGYRISKVDLALVALSGFNVVGFGHKIQVWEIS